MRLPVPFRPRPEAPADPRVAPAAPLVRTAPVAIVRRRRTSELNDPVWRLSLLCIALGVVAFVARTLLRPTNAFGVFAAAVPAALAWLAAVRVLLLEARRGRIWRIVLLLTALSVVPGWAGRGFAVAAGVVFLVFRRNRPFRHLTPVRRAKLFFLGLLAACLLTPGYAKLEDPAWLPDLAQNVLRTSVDLLRLFWYFTVLGLFFGMRLHFLRLKPKLAISALFLALVPILLLLAMGSVTLYSVVGGTLAARARTTMASWLQLLDREPHFGEVLFGPGFHYRTGDVVAAAAPAGATADSSSAPAAAPTSPATVPAFLPGLAELLAKGTIARHDSTVGLADTTAFVEAGGKLWALRARGVGHGPVEIWGHEVTGSALDRLARVLHLDVGLIGGDNVSMRDNRGRGIQIDLDADDPPAERRRGRRHADEDSTAAGDRNDLERGSIRLSGRIDATPVPSGTRRKLWDRDLYFGASAFPVLEYDGRRLASDNSLLTAKTSLRRLAGEFTSDDNEFNRAVLAVLAMLASVFLVLEGFALFFGIRITSTITSATQALYAGTKRLARGDLESQIDIPNEDEFGDLADSFNEMTAAVRRGREEAVVRELLEREIGTARRIQERLLPSVMPQLPGFEVAAHSEPSRQVGGDYFDFLPLVDGRLGLVIADVSGKGIPAAMLMANLQACLQAQSMHPESVAQILGRVNNQLARSTDASMFATLFMGALDATSGEVTGACAGHDPPILCRADGTVDRLRAGGLILGMLPDMRYEQETLRLLPGDVLVMYTDGITEAMGPVLEPAAPSARPAGRAVGGAVVSVAGAAGAPAEDDVDEPPDITTNFFEERRLLDVVRAQRHRSAAQIRDAILRAVAEHTAGIPQSDDITLIVLKRLATA